jgi:hypothetical protein
MMRKREVLMISSKLEYSGYIEAYWQKDLTEKD